MRHYGVLFSSESKPASLTATNTSARTTSSRPAARPDTPGGYGWASISRLVPIRKSHHLEEVASWDGFVVGQRTSRAMLGWEMHALIVISGDSNGFSFLACPCIQSQGIDAATSASCDDSIKTYVTADKSWLVCWLSQSPDSRFRS